VTENSVENGSPTAVAGGRSLQDHASAEALPASLSAEARHRRLGAETAKRQIDPERATASPRLATCTQRPLFLQTSTAKLRISVRNILVESHE
jgi:hypothetical protein